MVIWLCGPSGSGKTTIGRALDRALRPRVPSLFLLDGDEFRAAMGHDLGFSPEDRRKNGYRIARFCQLLESQGISVICCGATIHPEVQAFNRLALRSYCEIVIEVSLETLLKRDVKGIYQKALSGEVSNVVGVDLRWLPPSHPHLVLNNDAEATSFDHFVHAILTSLSASDRMLQGLEDSDAPPLTAMGLEGKDVEGRRR